MNDRHVIGNEWTGEATAIEQHEADALVDEVRERERRLRPSVEQTVQARIDYGAEREVTGPPFGLTLAEEERLAAREWEIERTRRRWDRGQTSTREGQCRAAVEAGNANRRREFAERAASVERWADPDEPDAREQLSRADLGRVNREARRLSEALDGWSRAAISRLVARRTVETGDVVEAALATMDALQVDPGGVVPISRIGEVRHREVSVEGVVTTLWEPSHSSIAQVGLLEDDTGRTKVTSWRKSGQPPFAEGDRLRIRDAARSWYDGRWSIALTGRSRVIVDG